MPSPLPTHPQATSAELAALASAVDHHCSCTRWSPDELCAAHRLLYEPDTVVALLRARRQRAQLFRAERSATSAATRAALRAAGVVLVSSALLLVLSLVAVAAIAVLSLPHGPFPLVPLPDGGGAAPPGWWSDPAVFPPAP
jgi:hypothetical protein